MSGAEELFLDIIFDLVPWLMFTVGGFVFLGVLLNSIKFFRVVESGTQVVLERLGKFHSVLEPGVHFHTPFLVKPKKVKWSRVEEVRVGQKTNIVKKSYTLTAIPTQEQVHDLPEFRSFTKDRFDVFINGLIFFKIVDVKKAAYNINDLYSAIENIVETAIRDYTSTAVIEDIFVSRDKMMAKVVSSLSDCEENWGVKITRFDIQEINPSRQVKEATEKEVLKKRSAESRLQMAEANKKAQLLEIEAENEVKYSKAQAEAKLLIQHAENEKSLQEIHNQKLIAESERMAKQKEIEQEIRGKNLIQQSEAEAEALRRILDVPGIDESYIRHRNQMKAWESMSQNPNNKIVLPYDSVPLLGAQALLKNFGLGNTDKTSNATPGN